MCTHASDLIFCILIENLFSADLLKRFARQQITPVNNKSFYAHNNIIANLIAILHKIIGYHDDFFTSDRSLVHASVSMTVLSLPLKLNAIVEPHSSTKKTADAKPVVAEDFISKIKKISLGKKTEHWKIFKTILRKTLLLLILLL